MSYIFYGKLNKLWNGLSVILRPSIPIIIITLSTYISHFVEDEYYDYSDDMHLPDYVCQDMMEAVIAAIKSGNFPDEELQRMKDGIEKLEQTKACEDYGVPYALNVWGKFLNK